MNCILLSSSDHVLGKGFLIHVAGFHTSVVSPDFIFVSREKQNKRTLYTVATCKENIMHGGIWNAPISARVGTVDYKFAHLHKYLRRGCFRWIGKNAKKLKRTTFRQSAANLNFFPYRLHNETLDKKINSTHDCQAYYNFLGVEISRHFSTSALLRIYSKRMAVTNQPLCQPSPQAFSARSILGCFPLQQGAQKCDL